MKWKDLTVKRQRLPQRGFVQSKKKMSLPLGLSHAPQ